MKKLLILVMSLALILCSMSALAETAEATEKTALGNVGTLDVNGVFAIKSKVPEGYTYTPIVSDELGLVSQMASADGSLVVTISIMYNDEYADIERLNDVDEENIEIIKQTFLDMDDVAFEDLETAYGTRLLKVTDTFEGMDFVDIYTIYKGYEMEFVMAKIDGSDLTDDDVKMMVDFISDMDFVAE